MIHYHGSPIGGSRQDVARFLIGRHALVPYFRQDDMPIVADVCQSFVLDNSAFTIWKQGGKMDYEGYLAFVEHWYKHPSFDWALIPDVIDGTEQENDEYLGRWETKAKGVPVWHLHESIERLKMLCDQYEVVALGSSGKWSMPGEEQWWFRMSEAMDAICDEEGRPPCRLHGLRMLNPEVFTRLPLASADSTNAGRNNCLVQHFGRYAPPTAAQRTAVIADRIEAHNSAAIWVRSAQMKLAI
jgi:hypothetical protein